jgi:hypothetical protein
VAQAIISGVSLYLIAGVNVALVLLPLLGRIDPAARGAYGFRLLLAPGVILLWPLVIWSTLRALKRSDRRSSP